MSLYYCSDVQWQNSMKEMPDSNCHLSCMNEVIAVDDNYTDNRPRLMVFN